MATTAVTATPTAAAPSSPGAPTQSLAGPGPAGPGPSGPGSTLKVPLNLKAVQTALQNKPRPVEKKVNEEAAATIEELPAQHKAFTPELLQQHWQGFFSQLKNSNGSPIELMLANATLEPQNENDVRVWLSSSLQEEPFERLKPKLQHYLRQHLQNSQLNLQPQLAEESGPRRLYTNNEKFQHLLQQYPLLGELKERLGLESDF